MAANIFTNILNKALPVSAILQGLGNLNPKMKRFVQSALGAGFGANEIIGYLKEKSSPQNFAEGASHVRPDEQAALNRQRKESQHLNLAKNAAVGAAALAGGGIGATLGGALTAATGNNDAESAQGEKTSKPTAVKKESLQDKVVQDVQKQQTIPSDPLSSLKKRYPDLARYVEKQAIAGHQATDIARGARSIKALKNHVDKIEKEIDGPFDDLLTRLLGSNQEQSKSSAAAPSNMSDADLIAQAAKILQM